MALSRRQLLLSPQGEKDATRENAIALLEDFNALAHMIAHKVIEDERSGKVKPVKIKKPYMKK